MDYAAVYGELHENAKRFPGYTLTTYVEDIADLVKFANPQTLLDYGCGKGYQYLSRRLHERWGGLLPHCYDIGVRQLQEKPTGKFDGVISTDMLEHIEKPDLPGIIDELIGYVNDRGDEYSFLFLSIACRPSKKNPLPGGRNAHVTIEHPDWWVALIEERLAAATLPAKMTITVRFDTGETFPDARKLWGKTL